MGFCFYIDNKGKHKICRFFKNKRCVFDSSLLHDQEISALKKLESKKYDINKIVPKIEENVYPPCNKNRGVFFHFIVKKYLKGLVICQIIPYLLDVFKHKNSYYKFFWNKAGNKVRECFKVDLNVSRTKTLMEFDVNAQ